MTPRGYLSYSQFTTYKGSKKQYIKVYIEGQKSFDNKYTRLGSMLAEALETGEETGRYDIDLIVPSIPLYEEREVDITATLKLDGETIPLFGKLDTATKDKRKFIDHKSNVKDPKSNATRWTQKRVDEDEQLTIYSLILYKGYRIPLAEQEIGLVVMETELDENGEPQFTGKITHYKTKRNLQQILRMQAEIVKVWRGIKELTAENLL
jgi:hypothetical protein